MFKRIKLRMQDMKTISQLISGAEEYAHGRGEEEVGAEHLLLSALALSDGSARRVFERAGVDPDKLQAAIDKQYCDALNVMGIDGVSFDDDPEPIKPTKLFRNAKPSGQATLKALYALKQKDKDMPLLGAHVVAVVANMEHGVAARALRTMGVNQQHLAEAVKEELELFCNEE